MSPTSRTTRAEKPPRSVALPNTVIERTGLVCGVRLPPGESEIPIASFALTSRDLRQVIKPRDVERALESRAKHLSDPPPRDNSKRVARTMATRTAEAVGVTLAGKDFDDMFEAAMRSLEIDGAASEVAARQARSIALTFHDGRFFLLRNDADGLVAIGCGDKLKEDTAAALDEARKAAEDEAKFWWYIDMFGELVLGVLGVAGAKPKPGADVAKPFKELLRREKVKRAFAAVIDAGFSLDALIEFIKVLMDEDDIGKKLLEILDCGLFAILWGIAKFGVKLTPGVGTALITAAFSLLAVDLTRKFLKGPKLPE